MNINPCLPNSQRKNQYKHSNRAQYQTASARLGSQECACISYEVIFQWLKFPSSPLISIASFSADIRKKQYRLHVVIYTLAICVQMQHISIWFGAQSDAFLSFYVFHAVNLFRLFLIWRTSSLHETLIEILGLGKKNYVCKWSLRNRYCLFNVFFCRRSFLHIWLDTMMWKCILIIPVGSSTADTFFFFFLKGGLPQLKVLVVFFCKVTPAGADWVLQGEKKRWMESD